MRVALELLPVEATWAGRTGPASSPNGFEELFVFGCNGVRVVSSVIVAGFGARLLPAVSDVFFVGSCVDDFFVFWANGVSVSVGLFGGKTSMAIKPRQAPMVSTLVTMAA